MEGVVTNHWMMRLVIVLLLAAGLLTAVTVVAGRGQVPIGGNDRALSPGDSFIYLFDSTTSSFIFTFTIPTTNANAWDVEVVPLASAYEVWVTEPGADQIGRLVYTSTSDYAYEPFLLPSGSYPLNLQVDDDYVWFTAPGRNLIGRLNRTDYSVDEFEVPTVNSYPADLAVTQDGRVWFTQMRADQLASLVVDSSGTYTVTEYQGATMERGRPYGIVVSQLVVSGKPMEAVFIAQTQNDRVTRYIPDTDRWLDLYNWVSADRQIPDGPYKLTLGPDGQLWGTGREGGAIYSFGYGTYPIVGNYTVLPLHSSPHSLVSDSSRRIWFTQYGAAQLGRLTPGSPALRDYYPLPGNGVNPTGIDLGGADHIWISAFRAHRVHLPIVVRNL